MSRKTEEEKVEGMAKVMTKELNKFLSEETPDDKELEEVERLLTDQFSTTTKFLAALADVLGEALEDEVGASLVRAFRVRFAAHEMETI